MTFEEYNYWLITKASYENNLKNNRGHKQSIEALLEKIANKLSGAVVV